MSLECNAVCTKAYRRAEEQEEEKSFRYFILIEEPLKINILADLINLNICQ